MKVLFVILLGLLALIVGWFWRRDRQYLKKKTSEAMRAEIWREIESERIANLEKRRKFHDALDQAKKTKSP